MSVNIEQPEPAVTVKKKEFAHIVFIDRYGN